jgi:hypothetical protein
LFFQIFHQECLPGSPGTEKADNKALIHFRQNAFSNQTIYHADGFLSKLQLNLEIQALSCRNYDKYRHMPAGISEFCNETIIPLMAICLIQPSELAHSV